MACREVESTLLLNFPMGLQGLNDVNPDGFHAELQQALGQNPKLPLS
jgi:hypothetical protein